MNLDNLLPLQVPIEYYRTIFENQNLNIKLLDFVDGVVKQFIRDGLTREIIMKKYGHDDLTNFMKTEIETNEKVRNLLDSIINAELADNQNLITDFTNAFAIK